MENNTLVLSSSSLVCTRLDANFDQMRTMLRNKVVTLELAMQTLYTCKQNCRKEPKLTPNYHALEQYLRSQTEAELTLTFAQIAMIVGAPLPASSVNHRAWWGNQKDTSRHAHKQAWANAGFRVAEVHQDPQEGWVAFERV